MSEEFNGFDFVESNPRKRTWDNFNESYVAGEDGNLDSQAYPSVIYQNTSSTIDILDTFLNDGTGESYPTDSNPTFEGMDWSAVDVSLLYSLDIDTTTSPYQEMSNMSEIFHNSDQTYAYQSQNQWAPLGLHQSSMPLTQEEYCNNYHTIQEQEMMNSSVSFTSSSSNQGSSSNSLSAIQSPAPALTPSVAPEELLTKEELLEDITNFQANKNDGASVVNGSFDYDSVQSLNKISFNHRDTDQENLAAADTATLYTQTEREYDTCFGMVWMTILSSCHSLIILGTGYNEV
jgi:hypothetical protein